MKYSVFNKLIFAFCLIVVGLNTLSIIFPALLIRLSSNFAQSPVNPFEIGFLTEYVIAANLCSVLLIILYKKSPNFHKKFDMIIHFLKTFDISNKFALILMITLGITYVVFSLPELTEPEPWGDYVINVIPRMENFSITEFTDRYIEDILHMASLILFDNIRVVPFLSSISLIIVVFVFTRLLAQKNISGILAVIVLLQSQTFTRFDTTATYPTYWTTFYLLSLFLITQKYHLSFISYIFSILSKFISIFFIPASLFFLLQSKLPKKQMITEFLIYIGLIISGTIVFFIVFPNITKNFFSLDRFIQGFSIITLELRFDPFVLVFLLPVGICLYYLSKTQVVHAKSMIVLIASSLLLQSFTSSLGPDIFPYRYLPTIVFFAMGIGLIFSKNLSGKNKIPKIS